MSWLSKALGGIRFDKHTLGNLVKNVSPAAALIGGPVGLAAAGGLSALGDLGRGKNIGEALKGGVKNAALGAGLNAGVGALRGALNTGVNSASSALPSAATDTVARGGLSLPSVPNVTTAATKAVDPRNIVERALDVGKGVGKFAMDHDKIAGSVLETGGDLLMGGANRRGFDARTALDEQQLAESRYDFERRKARNAQMAPLWSALGTTIGQGHKIAPNPYLPGGG